MNMRRWGAIVLAVSSVGVAGCGSDPELEAAQDLGRDAQKAFAPIKQDMVENGIAIGEATKAAEGKADDATAERFTELAAATRRSQEAIAGIEAPESEIPEQRELVTALDRAARSMDDVAAAAKDGDEQATATALQDLQRNSPPIDEARKKWEGALRTLVGGTG